jgi:hypothetical protein
MMTIGDHHPRVTIRQHCHQYLPSPQLVMILVTKGDQW